jgi:hypothetical protein
VPDAALTDNAALLDLCGRFRNPEQTALWCFSTEESSGKEDSGAARLVFEQGAAGFVTPFQMLKDLPDMCRARGIAYEFPIANNELFHLGLAEGPAVFEALKDTGVGVLAARACGDADSASFETAFCDMLIAYACSLDLSSDPDTHYMLAMNAAGRARFVSGRVFVIILLAGIAVLTAAFLIASAARRRVIIPRWRVFARFCWALPVRLAAMTLALETARRLVPLASGAERLPPNNAAACLLIALAMCLYGLITLVFDELKMPGKAFFYGYAAILTALLDGVILISLDITMISFCAGAFAFTLLGALWKNTIICYLAGCMIPLQGLGFFYALFTQGNSKFAAYILDAGLPSALMISLMLLPVLFVFRRGRLLIRRTITPRQRRTDIIMGRAAKSAGFYVRVIVLFMLAMGAGQVLVFYARQYKEARVDAPHGGIVWEGAPHSAALFASAFGGKEPLSVSCSETAFLARRALGITVESPARPVRFEIFLEGEDDSAPLVYAALYEGSYISLRRNETLPSRVDFILGDNPPNPFSFTLILDRDFAGSLKVRAFFNSVPDAAEELALERLIFQRRQ